MAHVRPGLLAQQLLGLGVVDQDLVQVFLVQDEEVGEAMSDHVGCASVSATNRQQTASQRERSREMNVRVQMSFQGNVNWEENFIFYSPTAAL